MKFRTKLLIVFLAVALLSNGLAMVLMYSLSKHYLFESFRSKVLTVADTTAALIDGDLHREIRTRGDESSPAYLKLKDQLRRARDANRRSDIYVKYLFTFKAPKASADPLQFAVDPEENRRDVSHVEDIYRNNKGRALNLAASEVDNAITADQWGTWISANAPLKDSSGALSGAVNADVSSAELAATLRPLWISALGSMALATTLALFGAVFLSQRVSRPVGELVSAVKRVGDGDFQTEVSLTGSDEFGRLGQAVNMMAAALRERETVKTAFARYVSQQVLQSILVDGKLPTVHGDRRRITVLFCDIRGFTTMSETMQPEVVVQVLNQYFEKVVEIVFRHQGMLDKFMGDGIMVVFGAPNEDPDQEEHALRTALEIREALRALSSWLNERGLPSISVGIGIHSGIAVVGNIGASERMEYTAIGDTVNLASRLESATRDLKFDILISEQTVNALRGSYVMEKVGPIHVKGRTEPVVAYTVGGESEAGSAAQA